MLKLFHKKRIYLDYASLTPIDKRVLSVMKKYSSNKYANPSSWYVEGVKAKEILESSRKSVSQSLGALADEIIFTGGGTESNNIAILGAIESQRSKGLEYRDMHVITSMIEHSSVLECFRNLEKKGVQVDYIGVDSEGIVLLDELKKKIKPNTVLVSIMMVNNEIGTVQPIREIAKIIRRRGLGGEASEVRPLLFHTDASQGYLYNEIDMRKLGVDLLTLDGSKVYGPRGVGILYVARGTDLKPVTFGGGQEKGIRSGTENIAAIAGLAKALEIGKSDRQKEVVRIDQLRQIFIEGLKGLNKGITINGSSKDYFPHILNISIPNIDNEFFVLQLDARGVACSTKSSCLRDEDESYVLKAMGKNSNNSVRFSFGRYTKKSDLDRVLSIISNI